MKKLKLFLNDGSVIITEKSGNKKELERSILGRKINLLDEVLTVTKVEFPSLKLTKNEVREISEKIQEIGDYFESEYEMKEMVDDILSEYNLTLEDKEICPDFIEENRSYRETLKVLTEEGEEIENFALFCNLILMENREKKPYEIIKYNPYF